MEAEIVRIQPQAMDYLEPMEAGRGKELLLPSVFKGCSFTNILIWDSGPPKLIKNKFLWC